MKFEAKTIQEAQEIGVKYSGISEIDYGTAKLESANRTNAEAIRIKEMFPSFKAKAIKWKTEKEAWTSWNGETVWLNAEEDQTNEKAGADSKSRNGIWDKFIAEGRTFTEEETKHHAITVQLTKDLLSGDVDKWQYMHTGEIGQNRMAATVRHELGHALHTHFNEEVSKVVGWNRYAALWDSLGPDVPKSVKEAFDTKDKEMAAKYGNTFRGKDTFAEAMAENFAAYVMGFRDKVHPELLPLFDELRKK